MKIAIVNYGLGNLGSVKNMLKKVGHTETVIADSPADIQSADKLILPGVGAFDKGMDCLNRSGLVDSLNEAALNQRKPVLGICLGAQLMTGASEEGKLPGLGWVDARVNRFKMKDAAYKVPHMGWNEVKAVRQHSILNDLPQPARFYFVHSYYIQSNKTEDVLLTCEYESEFCAAFQKDNMIGMQFHPEKSHKYGMQVFRNFISS